MKSIVYYDVSHGTHPVNIPDGTTIRIEDLISIALANKNVSEKAVQLLTSVNYDDIDPLGLKKSARWETLMGAIIYCLSGHLPLRQEILRGRQIVMALAPKFRKREKVEKVIFSLFPYLLIGFKSHIEDRFQEDSNRVASVASFIERFSSISDPVVTSFLCAHRGRSVSERHVLIDTIQADKALTALHVEKGLLANNPNAKTGLVQWHQQGPTEWACLNMFPEMFLRYLRQGEVNKLLKLLGGHFSALQSLADTPDVYGIEVEVLSLDPVTSDVLNFLDQRYGKRWRITNHAINVNGGDILLQIALEKTLPCVMRQMPFYSDIQMHKAYIKEKETLISKNMVTTMSGDNNQSQLVKSVIERFYEMQFMHPTAKALYETAFYYFWGMSSARDSRTVALGIDRDYAEFQYHAWKEGYTEGGGLADYSTSLLYARRTSENFHKSTLSGYSVRQFWR